MRVTKVGSGPDLGDEALGADDRGQILLEHLDRDVAFVPDVAREIDHRHSADTEFSLHAIVRQEGSRERRRDVGHDGYRNSLRTTERRGCDAPCSSDTSPGSDSDWLRQTRSQVNWS